MMFNSFHILFAILFTFSHLSYAQYGQASPNGLPLSPASDGVGNGGGAWACLNPDRSIRWAQLVDLYEAEFELPLIFPDYLMDDFDGLSEEIIFERIEFKIFKAHPDLYNELVPHIERVREIWQPQSQDLAFIDDASVRIVPDQAECEGGSVHYVQVANYTHYGRILIDSNIVDPYFDETHKAALRWHEVFYSYTRTKFFTPNSAMARLLTGISFSTWEQESLKEKFDFAMAMGFPGQTPSSEPSTNTAPSPHEEPEEAVLFVSDDLDNLYLQLNFSPHYLEDVGIDHLTNQEKEVLAERFKTRAREVLRVLPYLNESKDTLMDRFDRITNNPDEATHVLKLNDLLVSWSTVYDSDDVMCWTAYRFTITQRNNLISDHFYNTDLERNQSDDYSLCQDGEVMLQQMPTEMTESLKNIRPVFTEDRQKTLYLNPELYASENLNISFKNGVAPSDFSEITPQTIIEQTQQELQNYFPGATSPFWRISKGITTTRPENFDYELRISGPIKIEYGYSRIGTEVRKRAWRTIPLQILNQEGQIIKEYEAKQSMNYSSFSNGVMQISSKDPLPNDFTDSLNHVWAEITGNICRFPLDHYQVRFHDNMDQWINPYINDIPQRTLETVLSPNVRINTRRHLNMNIDLMREECLDEYRSLSRSL
jgi:hypothetical protein